MCGISALSGKQWIIRHLFLKIKTKVKKQTLFLCMHFDGFHNNILANIGLHRSSGMWRLSKPQRCTENVLRHVEINQGWAYKS